MYFQEMKHDLKAIKSGLSLLQMKYQQEFTSLGENIPCNKIWTYTQSYLTVPDMVIVYFHIINCYIVLFGLGEHLHGLAYAATGYQRVLEENRKLYNQVQDLKGKISEVDCRETLLGFCNIKTNEYYNREHKGLLSSETVLAWAKKCLNYSGSHRGVNYINCDTFKVRQRKSKIIHLQQSVWPFSISR